MLDECELKLAVTEIEDKRLLERIAQFLSLRLAISDDHLKYVDSERYWFLVIGEVGAARRLMPLYSSPSRLLDAVLTYRMVFKRVDRYGKPEMFINPFAGMSREEARLSLAAYGAEDLP